MNMTMDGNVTWNNTNMLLFKYPEIPLWTKIVQIVIMAVISVVGIPGNFLVMIVQTKLRDKSSTDYLVLTMAALDLCGSTFVTAIYMCLNVKRIWMVIGSDFTCRLQRFFIYWINISSTFLFAAVAFDRYMRTCHPLNGRYSSTIAVLICGINLTIGFAVAVLTFWLYEMNKSLDCVKIKNQQIVDQVLNTSLTAAFVVLFLMVVFCYTSVTLRLRARIRDKIKQKQKHNTSSRVSTFPRRANKIAPGPSGNNQTIASRSSAYTKKNKVTQYNNMVKSESKENILSALDKRANRKQTIVEPFICDAQTSDREVVKTTFTEPFKDKTDNKIYFLLPRMPAALKTLKSDVLYNEQRASENTLSRYNETVMPCENDKDMAQTSSSSSSSQTYPNMDETAVRILEKEQKKLNYITLMMFLITMTYILSWIVNWVVFATVDVMSSTGSQVIYLAKTSFVVNYVTNAVFYIVMSSKFREKAKLIICFRKK